MKHYVITIKELPQSVEYAERCIRSGSRHGLKIEMFDAITPQNTDIVAKMKEEELSPLGFTDRYSRMDNCMAAFLSHYSLWKRCMEMRTPITIFEHDAVIVDQLNSTIPFHRIVNLGRPSYGNYRIPSHLGTGPLTHKRYFGGAHAYRINQWGAKDLVTQAKLQAGPTDVFMNTQSFPYLQEHYPWKVEVRESFTTIQKIAGCIAKHGWDSDYEIL